MQVGYMRNRHKPTKYIKLLAKTTKYHGIELVFFHPEDINMDKQTVNGQILVNNKWITKEVNLPIYIDLTVHTFKYKEQLKYIKEHSSFMTGRLASKDITIKKLDDDGEFSHILIPTIKTRDFDTFMEFLNIHTSVIMKPTRGEKGQDIYMIKKNDKNYTVSYERDEFNLTDSELNTFFKETGSKRTFIIQRCINSRTKNGDPFDCRIRLEKNGKGKWENVINLIRIGSGQKVVSNVSSGGSVSRLTPFLKANYGDDWKRIRNSIIKISKTFPYKLEKVFDQELSSLGIDIGIEPDGKLFLFESNNAPGVEFGEGQVAMVKCDFYKYMLDKLSTK